MQRERGSAPCSQHPACAAREPERSSVLKASSNPPPSPPPPFKPPCPSAASLQPLRRCHCNVLQRVMGAGIACSPARCKALPKHPLMSSRNGCKAPEDAHSKASPRAAARGDGAEDVPLTGGGWEEHLQGGFIPSLIGIKVLGFSSPPRSQPPHRAPLSSAPQRSQHKAGSPPTTLCCPSIPIAVLWEHAGAPVRLEHGRALLPSAALTTIAARGINPSLTTCTGISSAYTNKP